MRKTITLIILFFITVLSAQNLSAQTDNKDVIITTSGSGITMEDAKQNALRSAIEQAFGTFISSKTEILNDNLVKDEIVSVTNGNIKSFEILNQDQLPDGRWGVTLKAVVSVDKLTSFVQAKGIDIEIKGGLFALNIKQQLLNEEGEIKAIAEMVGLLHEPMQTSFDYLIKSGDPKSIDALSKNWEIPLEVTAICNKNIDFCANYFIKTLSALSLTPAEVETYKSLNKQVFTLIVNYSGVENIFNFRKAQSMDAIYSFVFNWKFYTRLFIVESGLVNNVGTNLYKPGRHSNFGMYEVPHDQLGELTRNEEISEFIKLNDNVYQDNGTNDLTILFPSKDKLVARFNWNDKRTLVQIEQMTGYSVKPRGVVSYFKQGGYVVNEKDGHGLVVALYDIGKGTLVNAKKKCNEFEINGYNDWRLPSIEELGMIHKNMFEYGLGNLCPFIMRWGRDEPSLFAYYDYRYWTENSKGYWSNIEKDAYYSYIYDFFKGKSEIQYGKEGPYFIRPVRTF